MDAVSLTWAAPPSPSDLVWLVLASADMAGSSTTTTDYQNLSIILSSAILAVIGLGVLVVIFLVNRSVKKQNEGELSVFGSN